jgi:copper chaperone CopZ
MNCLFKISLVFGFVLSSNLTYSQEFSSSEKISEELNKVEVVFKEIINVQSAEMIISSLKEIDGVKEVELFYPTTTNGYLFISPKISAKLIIEKLASINIELNPKSLKN